MEVKVDEARENKTPFLAAVSLDEERHPQKMNLNVVDGFGLLRSESLGNAGS
ncbi:MAG: hypothetical protein IPI79_12620 [Moraxellaceae bacterium]|nr:hypothetical protein [Moraxellaceae bacterium]